MVYSEYPEVQNLFISVPLGMIRRLNPISLVSLVVSLFDASFEVKKNTKKATARAIADNARMKLSFLNFISFMIK